MPLVSVIIPCYNSASTIIRALHSVSCQSCDLEIIVVDDCSSDESARIVQKYAESSCYPVHLIRLDKNSGVSSARNAGLDAAKGKYVAFLDADDELHGDFCDVMVQCAEEEGAECVCCNAMSVSNLKQRMIFPPVNSCEMTVSQFGQNPKLLAYWDSCWGKLYSLELLKRSAIRFEVKLCFGEDSLFANRVLLNARKIVLKGDYAGYFYHDTIGSATKKLDVQKRLENLAGLLWQLNSECKLPEQRKILLRKSQEYVWTIKKFGGEKRFSLLRTVRNDRLFAEILLPVLSKFGKWKHRWLIRRINEEKFALISLL